VLAQLAAKEKLAYVGRHRILALKPTHEVLADDEALEGFRGELVNLIELHAGFSLVFTHDNRMLGDHCVAVKHHERRRGTRVVVVSNDDRRLPVGTDGRLAAVLPKSDVEASAAFVADVDGQLWHHPLHLDIQAQAEPANRGDRQQCQLSTL